jgi:RNA polymerase sigma factor (TIGR02999 family)
MSDVTRLLHAIDAGDTRAAGELLPLVYAELRRLAAAHLAREKPGQTLEATALVHEAYLRLVGDQAFAGRGHFFAAAAEAMRHILIDSARRKGAVKRGGGQQRIDLDKAAALVPASQPGEDLLALDEALTELEQHDEQAARLVKLRYFAGLTHQQAAEALGIGRRAADRVWALARAWLFQRLRDE